MTPERIIESIRPTGLAEWLQRRAAFMPHNVALSFEGRRWTYAELVADAEKVSARLAAGGVCSGERVAYLGTNHPATIITLFASARLGAIFVPLNFRLTGPELEYIIGDAGAHTIVCDEAHADLIEEIRERIECQHYLRLGDASPGWDSLEANADHPPPIPPAANVSAHATALIMYTSGTTGKPKGAMLSHFNLWVNNINWQLAVEFNAADISLNSAPLFHVGGLLVVTMPTLMAGGHVVLKAGFDAADSLATIARERVTVSFAVPAMLQAMHDQPEFNEVDLASVRLIIAGGASVPKSLLQAYGERGVPMSQGWGMTEASTAVTALPTSQAESKLGSCGRAVMLCDIKIVDFDGNLITEPGEKGEICARGPNIMQGYWNRPEATAEAFYPGGWFRSGDIGYCDAEGNLYICDRLKDMVISGGENVYPAEVENVLCEHPDIAEVAVIGAPDERWGERVVAVAVLRAGSQLSLEELKAFARKQLAGYKCPSELRLLDALPRNPGGKVLKNELRNMPTPS